MTARSSAKSSARWSRASMRATSADLLVRLALLALVAGLLVRRELRDLRASLARRLALLALPATRARLVSPVSKVLRALRVSVGLPARKVPRDPRATWVRLLVRQARLAQRQTLCAARPATLARPARLELLLARWVRRVPTARPARLAALATPVSTGASSSRPLQTPMSWGKSGTTPAS